MAQWVGYLQRILNLFVIFKYSLTYKFYLYIIFIAFMKNQPKYYISIFFTIIFMAFITAPTIISSIDDSIDISLFFNLNEEEESENFKLIFEDRIEYAEAGNKSTTEKALMGYTFKNYPKPHLNLITPPPEYKLV